MADTDAQVLNVVSKPVDSIPEVIAVFEALDNILPDPDGLKWFNWLYLTVTKSVDDNLSSGGWNNPAWLARLDVLFARLYLNAVASALTPGKSAAGCWDVFLSARQDARLARIQFALAGMNAHIDHDLSVAVVQTCAEFSLPPVHLSAIYQDYTGINRLLDALIDTAKKQLMVGLLGNSLPSIGLVEDLIAGSGISVAREAAWTNAELLWQAHSVPGLADRLLDALDLTATLAGKALLAPVGV